MSKSRYPKRKRHFFLVSINVPEELTRTDVERYIREALDGWRRSYAADDPFFSGMDAKGSIGVNYPPKSSVP